MDDANLSFRKREENAIKTICVILGAIWLYNIGSQFQLIKVSIVDVRPKDFADITFYLFFVPILLAPIAVIFFWKKKEVGWVLLAVYLTYTIWSAIYSFIIQLRWKPSGIPAFDMMFPHVSPWVYAGQFIFYSGILMFMCKRTTRDMYGVEKKLMYLSVGIVSALTLLLMKSF